MNLNHKKRPQAWFALGAMFTFAAAFALAGPGGTPQASITLTDSGAAICYAQTTAWGLTKTNDAPGGNASSGDKVTWTITVDKGAANNPTFCVVGFVTVKNTGSGVASIGNIVVNLQKPSPVKKTPWVSAGADIANATAGDAATVANIVAAGSQENSAVNCLSICNYALSGAKGTFKETAASGSLAFTLDDNSVWSLTNAADRTLDPGEEVTLKFVAKFDNSVMQLPVGSQARAEVLVSFANAGSRGGSGASEQNIDVDGDGTTNEGWVRTVPTRLTMTVPQIQDCNGTVTLTDVTGSTPGANVTDLQYDTFDPNGTTITDDGVYTVTGVVSGAGTVTNTASLDAAGSSLIVNGWQTDPVTGLPVHSFEIPCCEAFHMEASSSVNITNINVITDGAFCTGTVQEYKTSSKDPFSFIGGQPFQNQFAGGFSIGNPGSGSNYTASWTATAPGPANLKTFFSNASGASGKLTADTSNATSVAGGQLTGEVAALALNIAFSGDADAGWPSGFGSLKVCGTGSTDIDGLTISGVLNVLNTYIGTTAALPNNFATNNDVKQFVQNLNASFTKGNQSMCKVSAWAVAHLSASTCP